jgi:hypothetical protein
MRGQVGSPQIQWLVSSSRILETSIVPINREGEDRKTSPQAATSPYGALPPRAFWKSGVVADAGALAGLYQKKFDILPTDKIATAGSCFAQHISRHLRQSGYRVVDVERPPAGLEGDAANRYGYGLYSARYGNIYSVRQLLQLILEALGRFHPEDWIWEKDGRFYDALRPGVEPTGLASQDEVRAHRARHVAAVKRLFLHSDLLIFTMGLTEAWIHRSSGTVYATAPQTIAGKYSADIHEFKNFSFKEIYQDFVKLRTILKLRRPGMKFLVTVSPVPLTATASKHHVLSATVYSKSVLRAVAGQLETDFEDVDYFPSYEIIAAHPSRGQFYHDNLRSIRDEGVSVAMSSFLDQHPPVAPGRRSDDSKGSAKDVCEDELLEAFSE